MDPCLVRLIMPHMTLNCWYIGPSNKPTDEYITVCSRSCGPSDYHAEWRFLPMKRLFELVVMNYGTGENPKKIAECREFYQVLTYVIHNLHPHDLSARASNYVTYVGPKWMREENCCC